MNSGRGSNLESKQMRGNKQESEIVKVSCLAGQTAIITICSAEQQQNPLKKEETFIVSSSWFAGRGRLSFGSCVHVAALLSVFLSGRGQKALESTQEESEDSDRQGTGGKTDLSALWNGISHCLLRASEQALLCHLFVLTLHPWVW